MKTGMLWHDDDKTRSLADKVHRAAEYYLEKYGRRAQLCYVHPDMLTGVDLTVGDVRVMKSREVLPNHFWLGVEE